MRTAFHESSAFNVAFFSPWCDQGLGIQCRRYINILEMSKTKFTTSVFAFRPYVSEGKPMTELHQKDPAEWVHPRVYYSPNVREKVLDQEIIEFIRKFKVGKVVFPETCWFRVFEMANLLKKLGVKVFAVPNIEIVRRDEIAKHRHFYRILCNSRFCEKVFVDNGFKNTNYIGYSQGNSALPLPPLTTRKKSLETEISSSSKITPLSRVPSKSLTWKPPCLWISEPTGNKSIMTASDCRVVNFLNIGGMNAITRKQCLKGKTQPAVRFWIRKPSLYTFFFIYILCIGFKTERDIDPKA